MAEEGATPGWIPITDEAGAGRPIAAPNANRHALRFSLGLLAVIALGTLLLAMPFSSRSGEPTPPVDALFTAVSAASITGLAVVDTGTHWSTAGQVVVLLLIQVGGLGFAVGANLLLQMMRRGRGPSLGDQLLMKDGVSALSLREARELTVRIVRYMLVVEAIGAVALTLHFAAVQGLRPLEAAWRGLFLAVSAFCNAGFDLEGGFVSMAPYRSSVAMNLILMLLIQAGAIGFIVFDDVRRHRRWSRLPVDTKLVLLVNAILLALGTLVFAVAEWTFSMGGMTTAEKPFAAMFQSVAARSGGLATIDWSLATDTTLLLWLALMMVGGASGSTAGGVRLATIGVIGATVHATLRGRPEVQAFNRRIARRIVYQALTVVTLFVAVHFAVTLALTVTEDLYAHRNISFLALMFEAMSALATVGASTGITPGMSEAGKLVLCAAMFVGRLGVLTAAFALQGRQVEQHYRLPETPVRIG